MSLGNRDVLDMLNGGEDDAVIFTDEELHASKILVVDDETHICELVRAHLNQAGYHHVDVAFDGESGMKKIRQFNPDLVILDMIMPVKDGMDVLSEVRAIPHLQDLPVIVETAVDSLEMRNDVLRAGASNIVGKPIDPGVLIGRVQGLLERKILMQRLKSFRIRLNEELNAAKSMQLQLLPNAKDLEEIRTHFDVELGSHFQPSSELGGDIWGIQTLNGHQFAVYSADFSGHGVGAAINTFRLHSLMSEIGPPAGGPAAYMSEINNALVGLIPRGQFATMIYAICDVARQRISYAGCGAPGPIFGGGGRARPLLGDASGLPLGISPGARYDNHEIPFPPGGFMFLYSDAMLETPGKSDTALGDDGLLNLVENAVAGSAPGEHLDTLLDRFFERSVDRIPDDLTTVWIYRTG